MTISPMPLPPTPRPQIIVISVDTPKAAAWVAENRMAFAGCDVTAVGLRVAGLRLRGRTADRVYVVNGYSENEKVLIERDPMLEAAVLMALTTSAGALVTVGVADRITRVITAVCEGDACASEARVVVHNTSGLVTSHTPACPTCAPTFVGTTTERIEPIAMAGAR